MRAQPIETPYVLPALHPFRFRSVPLCRSANIVFTVLLTRDASRAAFTPFFLPSTTSG